MKNELSAGTKDEKRTTADSLPSASLVQNGLLSAVCHAVPYQLCPKCNGQGTVSKPPYISGDVHQWSSSSCQFQCDVCQGQKIIPMFIIPEEIKVLPEQSNYKQLRKEKGLTLREVEKLTGISNAYLSQLENGKIKKPSYDTIQKLNTVYNGR